MTSNDDIAAALPKHPPPAPAPRAAAIAAALRRFDGTDEHAGATTSPVAAAQPRRVKILGHPQAGLLVSAALIAVIGLPLGWLSLGPQSRDEGAPSPAMKAPAPTVDRPAATADAVGEVATESPAEVRPGQPPMASADRDPADIAVPDLPPAAPSPPPPMVSDTGGARSGQRESKPVELAMAPQGEATEARERAASPRAAPVDEPDASSISVSGARKAGARPAMRGDWDACTVNDPRQNLARCQRLVDPKRPGAAGLAASHLAQGLSRAWRGDSAAAIDAFDRAIASDPQSSFAYLNRGLVFADQGDLDRAIADLDQAIRREPRAARGYYNRSVLLWQRGDRRRADADARRAADLDARHGEVTAD